MEKNIKRVPLICKVVKSERGYTLLEVIIALGVLLMLTSIIPLFLIPLQKAPPISQLEDTILFFSMIGKEIREASAIEIQNNQLNLAADNGNVTSFSKYHSLIRKQVNGMGHEVWLQNINSLEINRRSENFIEIEIIDSLDQKYHRVFQTMNK
ncbi:ComGF family competence protein [Fictibacillus barbaricus]|uniref:Competence protein ComGF n=1 Tax=Fictibacillus barbaricus TaxID=182136 RepID=A0ABU1TZQ8_9BACL|nr:ComGF family competence protein [Fictibacillus barbaricus]MDR7072714.1 competence protein ComGF [Fictibacillus barbaricus]